MVSWTPLWNMDTRRYTFQHSLPSEGSISLPLACIDGYMHVGSSNPPFYTPYKNAWLNSLLFVMPQSLSFTYHN